MMKQHKKRLTLAGLTLAVVTLSGAALAHSDFGGGFGHAGADCDRKGHKGQGYPHQGNKGSRKEHHGDYQEKRMEKRISRMQHKLDLNEDQVTRLTALFEQQKQNRMDRKMPEQRHPMMSIDPGARDYDRQVQQAITERQALMAEHMQAKAEFRKELHQILTPEQREKMQQWRNRHQD